MITITARSGLSSSAMATMRPMASNSGVMPRGLASSLVTAVQVSGVALRRSVSNCSPSWASKTERVISVVSVSALSPSRAVETVSA